MRRGRRRSTSALGGIVSLGLIVTVLGAAVALIELIVAAAEVLAGLAVVAAVVVAIVPPLRDAALDRIDDWRDARDDARAAALTL